MCALAGIWYPCAGRVTTPCSELAGKLVMSGCWSRGRCCCCCTASALNSQEFWFWGWEGPPLISACCASPALSIACCASPAQSLLQCLTLPPICSTAQSPTRPENSQVSFFDVPISSGDPPIHDLDESSSIKSLKVLKVDKIIRMHWAGCFRRTVRTSC